MNQETFMKTIQRICSETNLNYIEAICQYCKEQEIDVEEVVPLIGRPMTERLKKDAMDSGMMKREGSLPI